MARPIPAVLLLALPAASWAQFVVPKPEDNRPVPGTYVEDPFIVEYRHRFFAVFHGDVATFNKAYAEIEAMVAKNPKDARALVWLGNGETIRAGIASVKGKREEAAKLLETSRKTLDRAVALRPNDPNIFMMRVATLYVQGQYMPALVPRSAWETMRDDCRHFVRLIGPERMKKVSVHVRGEAYGEMGIACKMLGDVKGAREAFQKVIELDPGTAYETRARKEIASLVADSR